MPSWSSYNYAFSNPIKFNDPTGMAPEVMEFCPADWVRGKNGDTWVWREDITTEKQANDEGLEYGGKTTQEVWKKQKWEYFSFFQSRPEFDMKSRYEKQINEAIYESINRNQIAQIKKATQVKELQNAGKANEAHNLSQEDKVLYDPIDLSFINDFPIVESYSSWHTNLQKDGASWKVLIRIQNVPIDERVSTRLLHMVIPPEGNNLSGSKGSQGNWYQYRIGNTPTDAGYSPAIKVIFGPVNKEGYNNFLNHKK